MNTIQSRYEVGAKTIADDTGFEMEFCQRKKDAFDFAQRLRVKYPNKNDVSVYVYDRMGRADNLHYNLFTF